ncbi:GAF domain-like protein [Lipomyces tetrasporus]|uniref:GAF domain-like protein n=1 Tax=Lipomyces tetrasporus TaxID=54092 RepID=A0AAD7QRB9_9ASCO|nr:GAF domain-like protein [Lipomyces tetrasporus]KAJ8100048.1 GAF domain-like protein [Lipomyces tetrasporus]
MPDEPFAHHADAATFAASDKSDVYETVLGSAAALVESQRFWATNLANAASLMWHAFEALDMRVNWAGFYVVEPRRHQQPQQQQQGTTGEISNRTLALGPFMGKVACQTIEFGRGVCGTAAASGTTVVVADVDKFPGHIACDGATKSEVVVPILDDAGGVVRGVLDVDCLVTDGFDDTDVEFLEKLAGLLGRSCDWDL